MVPSQRMKIKPQAPPLSYSFIPAKVPTKTNRLHFPGMSAPGAELVDQLEKIVLTEVLDTNVSMVITLPSRHGW